MKKLIVDNYITHIDTSETIIRFEVYPIQTWEDTQTGEKTIHYIDKEKEPEPRASFEEGKCLKKLEGSFCWRGVWEGRLYFTDEEYWGQDIEELSRLYNDNIVRWCKDLIKNRDPHDYYDE